MEGSSGSQLRHRSAATASTPSDDSPPAAAPKDPTPTWQEELASARRAVAERVRQQQEDDGWEDIGEEEEALETGEAAGGGAGGRRGSASSEELVREMLQSGSGRTTPVVIPAGEGLEGADEAPRQVPQAPVAPGLGAEAGARGGQAAGAARRVPVAEDDGEKLCRFCFDGEDPESGRLFSPCLCRGTSRYVHVGCLEAWRVRSVGEASFFRCDQCLFEYKLGFGRTKFAGLATNRIALSAMTTVFFVFLIFLAGFISTYLIERIEARQAQMTGSIFEDIFVSDYVIVGEGVREAVNLFKNVEESGWSALKSLDFIDLGSTNDQKRLAASPPGKPNITKTTTGEPRASTLFMRTLHHFFKGFSLVGLLSFVQLTIASSPMFLLRMLRPPRRREGDTNRPSMTQVVIVLAVLWGLVKAILQVYRFVRWSAGRMLRRLEVFVLDVGAE